VGSTNPLVPRPTGEEVDTKLSTPTAAVGHMVMHELPSPETNGLSVGRRLVRWGSTSNAQQPTTNQTRGFRHYRGCLGH